jgi:hypothetical protein
VTFGRSRARRLRTYRYATGAFAGDPQALDLVDRLSEDWAGDGEQLVTLIRAGLHAVEGA